MDDHTSRAPSPYVGICRPDAAGRRRLGHRRTLTEIAAWRDMPEEEKWRVLVALPDRLIGSALD